MGRQAEVTATAVAAANESEDLSALARLRAGFVRAAHVHGPHAPRFERDASRMPPPKSPSGAAAESRAPR